MSDAPSPSDPDWSAWATFANHVSDALMWLPDRPLLGERTKVAAALWMQGYRPTDEQIMAMVESQRRRA